MTDTATADATVAVAPAESEKPKEDVVPTKTEKSQENKEEDVPPASQKTPPAVATADDTKTVTAATSASATTSTAEKTPSVTVSGVKRPPPSSFAAVLALARRRPYRRTKKPKGYCDKSTVTTTTDTAMTPVNVYDAVLGEAEDLLTAAMEAQALGRLKMASAYQLLSHARLVGLGKRFDRAHVLPEPHDVDDDESSSPTSEKATPKQEVDEQQQDEEEDDEGSETTDGETRQHPVSELARLLPSNIELDTIMMEHLARAAVELHHQRTGRKISADGLLASPMNGFLAAALQPSPLQTIKTNEANERSSKMNTAATTNGSKVTLAAPGVAWTEEEKTKLQKALRDGMTDPNEIAKLVETRSDSQVKAYMRNITERQKGTAVVEQDFGVTNGGEETPRKRGGRGRKPPTTAMNTVPNAKLNARSLLQGKGL